MGTAGAGGRRILIAVTHLTGTGHLVRSIALGRALAERGARVRLLSGGRPLPHLGTGGLDIVQLPPVAVRDLDYSTLRTPDGTIASEAYLARRQTAALDALDAFGPDLLVTETWPFGRGSLRREFAALAAAAPRRVASIRDIPEPPRDARKRARAEAALAGFDAVLVHGDPAVCRFAETWPLPPDLAARVHETGYVATPLPPALASGEVLVSVGGGALGRDLLDTAARAACLPPPRGTGPLRWRLLVGGADAARTAQRLGAIGPARAEPVRADYRGLLQGAACSVSLCGYNTATDLLACRTPALVLPMGDHGEREQGLRAAALARFGITPLDPAGLTPGRLATAVTAAIAAGPRPPAGIALDGAERAAGLLLRL